MWDEITHSLPNFNGCTVEVWEWISNFIPNFIMDVITHPCWDHDFSVIGAWIIHCISSFPLDVITHPFLNLSYSSWSPDWYHTKYTNERGSWAPSQCSIRRLIVRSREVSKLQDLYLELSDSFEIWQALRQHCCPLPGQPPEALTAENDCFQRSVVASGPPYLPVLIKISADKSPLNQLTVKNFFFSLIIKTFCH